MRPLYQNHYTYFTRLPPGPEVLNTFYLLFQFQKLHEINQYFEVGHMHDLSPEHED